jgi:carbon storage regulator
MEALMVVFSRKQNESIVIDDVTTVTVVEIRGDKVRLGVVAPKEASVHRQEVHDAIHPNGAPGQAGPGAELARLKAELAKAQQKLRLYQDTLAAIAEEEWRGVTREDLERLAKEESPIASIIAELEAGTQP